MCIRDSSYYNMREKVVEHPHILDIAQQAMRDCDIEPELKPIRGGTDGAQLSFSPGDSAPPDFPPSAFPVSEFPEGSAFCLDVYKRQRFDSSAL